MVAGESSSAIKTTGLVTDLSFTARGDDDPTARRPGRCGERVARHRVVPAPECKNPSPSVSRRTAMWTGFNTQGGTEPPRCGGHRGGCGGRVVPVRRRRSAGGGALDVVLVGGLDPAHQTAQLASGRLDRVLGALLAQSLELRRAGVLVLDEAPGEGAVLDVLQDGLHVLLHVRVDDARAGHVVAVLSRVGDGPALLGDAALDHQVDDELELVQAL